jgi:hypothetical protein
VIAIEGLGDLPTADALNLRICVSDFALAQMASVCALKAGPHLISSADAIDALAHAAGDRSLHRGADFLVSLTK